MSTKMRLYHEIVPATEPPPYWSFAIETTFRCDHCDNDHVESHRYIVAEQFCPSPDSELLTCTAPLCLVRLGFLEMS